MLKTAPRPQGVHRGVLQQQQRIIECVPFRESVTPIRNSILLPLPGGSVGNELAMKVMELTPGYSDSSL